MATKQDSLYWVDRYEKSAHEDPNKDRNFRDLNYCPKVKNTKWAAAEKPYLPIPVHAQMVSSELHWIYETTKALGKGNFAHLGVAWGASVWVNSIAAPTSSIYAVDLWSDYVLDTDKDKLQRLCKNVVMCEGSTETWGESLNVPLKFVFIDADHSYEFVKKDWELWSPKVEVGGIVGFHDADMEAVRKVCNSIGHRWQPYEGIHSIRAFKKT